MHYPGIYKILIRLSLYRSHFQRIFQNTANTANLGAVANKFLSEKKSYVSVKGFDSGIISSLIDWGIIRKNNDLFSFSHLDMLGYLAGLYSTESEPGKSISKISRNPIEFTYAGFLSSQENHQTWIEEFIQEDGSTIKF